VFESAPYFVLVDTAGRSFKVEANPNAGLPAYGTQTAQLMTNLGVGGVVAGSFGQNAGASLAGQRIAAYPGVAGAVQDAVNAYGAGALTPAQSVGVAAGQALPTPQVVQTQSYPQTLY